MPAAVLNPATLQTDNLAADLSASSVFKVSTVVDSSKNIALVVPFLAQLDGTSTATMNLLDISQNTAQEVHALFKAVLDVSECIQLLNSFRLTEGNNVPTYGSGNTTTNQDVSYNVVLDNSGAFAEVLAKAMSRAVVMPGIGDEDNDISGTTGAHFSLKGGVTVSDISNSAAAYMREKMRDYVVGQLTGYAGTFASLLIPTNLKTVTVTLDASGGSKDMADRIVEGSAPMRNLLLSQIPAETLRHYISRLIPSYVESGAVQPDFLPMKGGDELTFVFVTKVTDPAHIGFTTTTSAGTDICSNAVIAGDGSPGFLNGQVVRRIGFVLQLGDKQAYFKRDICSALIPSCVAHVNGVDIDQSGNVFKVMDLSQAMLDVSSYEYASRIPYILSTTWSSTDSSVLTAALGAIGTAGGVVKSTANSDAYYGLPANSTAKGTLGTAIDNKAPFVLDASAGSALRVVVDLYNKKVWEYALLDGKDKYEKARANDYANAPTKSWDAGLVVGAAGGAVVAKTGTGSKTNGM